MRGPKGEQWEIEPIPDDTGLSEEVITKIAGSRLPVLFIEGDGASLDSALYRRVYDEFTIIPVGPCENVIHSVASFAKHGAFHRLKCAGLVDADGRHSSEVRQHLASKNVYVLSVSEVENVLLLPKPFLALAKLQQFDDATAKKKLADLTAQVLKTAQADVERYATDATRRCIDAAMKKVGLDSKTIVDLVNQFAAKIAYIDPAVMCAGIRKEFEAAIAASDYPTILRVYDNKGLLAEAARILGMKGWKELEEFIGRALQNKDGSELLAALKGELPTVTSNGRASFGTP